MTGGRVLVVVVVVVVAVVLVMASLRALLIPT
jgi:hypothetical protein